MRTIFRRQSGLIHIKKSTGRPWTRHVLNQLKLALFGLFENKSGKDVLTIELKPRLPRGITDEEFDAAMDQLETQHYVSYR